MPSGPGKGNFAAGQTEGFLEGLEFIHFGVMAVPHRPSKAIRNSPSRFNCNGRQCRSGYHRPAGESHHHVNGSGGGDPAAHRRSDATPEIKRVSVYWTE